MKHRNILALMVAAIVGGSIWAYFRLRPINMFAGAYGDCVHDDWRVVEDNLYKAAALSGDVSGRAGCFYFSKPLVVPAGIVAFDGGGATLEFDPTPGGIMPMETTSGKPATASPKVLFLAEMRIDNFYVKVRH
jgi:hypothetical protein